MYVTAGYGVEAYCADDPFGIWLFCGYVCTIENAHNFWAPAVIKIEDIFYLYFSCQRLDENGNETTELMHVATSKSPLGPFENAKTLSDCFCIDAHPVLTDRGLYLFYAKDDLDCKRIALGFLYRSLILLSL